MDTNRILAWVATIIALPTVGWVILTCAQSNAKDAEHDIAIKMMNDHFLEAREEDRAFRTEMKAEVGKMADGFNAMGKSFAKMEGIFEALEFKVNDDE